MLRQSTGAYLQKVVSKYTSVIQKLHKAMMLFKDQSFVSRKGQSGVEELGEEVGEDTMSEHRCSLLLRRPPTIHRRRQPEDT